MAPTSATYRRLDQDELRLVLLLPGSSSSELQCELVYTSFHTHPEYEAVSYTWGDPSITEVIILDGRPVTITAGLARALHSFRQPKEKCTLWIDAICINQRDDEEKNHQVQLMFDIYRNSKAVRAWIGRLPGEESEDRAQSLHEKLDSKFGDLRIQKVQSPLAMASIIQQDPWNVWNLIEMLGKLADRGGIEYTSISESLESSTEAKAWKDLCLLLLRPYWRRVWIQQEILEISKVVVHCGSVALSLSMFLDSRTAVFSCIDAAKRTGSQIPAAASFVEECYLQIHNLQYSSGPEHEAQDRVPNLLRSQMFRQTSDPRDKIYGIVGLVPSWRSTFPINYRLSTHKVYISLFKFIVQKHNNLEALVDQISLNAPRLAGLPSWCPDWSQTALPNYVVDETDGVHSAYAVPMGFYGNSTERPAVFSFAGNDHVLVVKGVILDVCESVTACFSGTDSLLSPVQKELLDDTIRLARRSVHGPNWHQRQTVESSRQIDFQETGLKSLERDEPIKPLGLFQCDFEPDAHWFDQEEAILRTLVANIESSFDEDVLARLRSQTLSPGDDDGAENVSSQPVPATSHSGASNSSFQDNNQASGHIRLKDIITPDVFWQPTRHRRFFVSSKNYIGLSPAGSQADDLVCILFGCSLPVMLRRINDHFVFVGPTYVHGYMNGEVESLLQSGKIQPQDFEIH